MTIEVMEAPTDPELHLLDRIVIEVMQVLHRRQGVLVDASRVRELVEREWARFPGARVRTYLPVLVRRAVVDDVLHCDRPPSPAAGSEY